ncbi:nicotinate-nucleotide--dimethylbenzimidazole phosphoribosyltransferase [Arthrobacter sp.]|uniref:nicotinate-nucleotide--dimethylbenzimidazole phosphoribosyltransferase n=1 Tax=Arthrobacter sp. TaxID=1667 RepID=UPI002589E99F|nr:nicotinate-nucleotide--dimethylbenzimidazole phosphoribosyltransferase [Arthrobacter sp.]
MPPQSRELTAAASRATSSGLPEDAFPVEALQGVYQAIFQRRDIRSFRADPFPDDVLARLLNAAHHAPSVGFMQPWSFVLVRDRETRTQVQALFERERQAAACFFDEPRRSQYLSLKLEGILEAPLNLCVTCDPTAAGPAVLGRNSIPETDVYSTCCAVENLWLAARAEGIGVGWVSIIKLPQLREILGIPPHVVPVAYLCLGYPADGFPVRPVLQTAGWHRRTPLGAVLHYERWGTPSHPTWPALDQLLPEAAQAVDPNAPLLDDTIRQVGELDRSAMETARLRQDVLTKPQGSLGRLEALHVQLAGISGNPLPVAERKAVIVMAGDHGITAEGVSAYPAAVTPQMVLNFVRGGAAINVLARQAGARVVVVDMGVAADLPADPAIVSRPVARGTFNMAHGPAMTRSQASQAVASGIAIVNAEIARGLDLVATGDMGIGNTAASSAIVAAITGKPVADLTGRGTGIDDAGLRRKVAAIEQALAVNRPDPHDPLDVLAKVGGFEIGGLVGVILGAAAGRVPVLIDGFISGAAALLAAELCPAVRGYLVAAHTSVEVGHRAILERLELIPLMTLDLRLGEGTGAALAMHLVEAACRIPRQMATFAQAGVAERSAEP